MTIGPDAARRAWGRERAHLVRLVQAVRRGGPGRLLGGVAGLVVEFDRVVVEGWVGAPGRRVIAVLVTLDDVAVATAELGLPTPTDAGGTPFTTRAGDHGWRATFGRLDLPLGTHRFGAIAVLSDGLTEGLLPLDATLHERRLGAGWLDQPIEGAPLAAPVAAVEGWLRPELGYDRVEVSIDDGPAQRARLLAVPRPGVAELVPDPSAPLAGWQVLLDVPLVDEPAAAVVTVHAIGPSGRAELGRRDVLLVPPVPPSAPDPARLAGLSARTDAVGRQHRPRTDGVHLLVATHHLGLGGGQLYLHELLKHVLSAEDVSCTVLAPDDGPLRRELESWGARVHTVGPVPHDGHAYEARMLELCHVTRATGANVVLANTVGSFWGVDLAHRCGLAAVWAVHESFAVEHFLAVAYAPPLDGAVEARLRDAFAAAEVVAFEADATRRLFEPLGDPDRFVRIDYGVDTERIARHAATTDRDVLRADLGFEADDTVLLCLGTYEPRKAQGALAVAFARVAADHPEATLALVGDTGTPFAAAVHQVVARLALGDRIRLLPITADIDAWYRVADGFVLASDVESLPRSMLEAMAHGTPVLGSAVFGVPELIADGDTGLLFEPLCLGSLTDALRRFLDLSTAERRAIGERGRKVVVDHRPSNFYADTYRSLLAALATDRTVLPRSVMPLP
jgi:D-inositol-3-phosphate glycosyltransferase